MVKLSVNINKIATIRNARGANTPDVIKAALDIEQFGADGITVHPRPDERHIRKSDVYGLKPLLKTEFNIEGYPSPDFLQMIKEVKPAQVTLVPDPPHVLTSNAGWDCLKFGDFLKEIISTIKEESGARVSIFLNPEPEQVQAAKETGTDRIELYTEAYAKAYPENPEKAITPYIETAKKAVELGLGVNAGHDLSLENLEYFAKNVPGLLEVSIGHALISDALYFGLQNTVMMYKRKLG
ncbi:MAG TPA: pyridoxine 5'-phosphate synthase [Bacteroidia bacterium]